MEQKLRIEGIYDKRTLKHLKDRGLQDFCFDFSPKSFNFIQEYVFLEQIISLLDSTDRVFLHFSRSNDPMVEKLVGDLKNLGHSLNNLFFEFDEWSQEVFPLDFAYNYLLNFTKDSDASKLIGKNFKGFSFNYDFFDDLHRTNLLNNFAGNFYTRYNSKINDESLMILKMDWQNNLMASLFDLFEFNVLSFPINSKIEVCYRNVDLKKLNTEMGFLENNVHILRNI